MAPTTLARGYLHLTVREAEVLALLAAGASTEEAARELHISPHTVTHHIGRMIDRTGARNRTELVARGYAQGALKTDSWPPKAGVIRGPEEPCS